MNKDILEGKPYLGETVDWAKKYAEHLQGLHAEIPFAPTEGISQRSCTNCFYRAYPGQRKKIEGYDCSIVPTESSKPPHTAKEFFGIPEYEFLPGIVNGKDVGNFCPFWTDPRAD